MFISVSASLCESNGTMSSDQTQLCDISSSLEILEQNMDEFETYMAAFCTDDVENNEELALELESMNIFTEPDEQTIAFISQDRSVQKGRALDLMEQNMYCENHSIETTNEQYCDSVSRDYVSRDSVPHAWTSYTCNQALPSFDKLYPPSSSFQEGDALDSEAEEDRELKRKRGAKNILLWKFLLEELGSRDQRNIRWMDMERGIFRFVDTMEISKLWGAKKKKQDMNFEKLSRGIRHYYQHGMMTREEGTRLVYRFHWEKIPRKFRRRFVKF